MFESRFGSSQTHET